MKKLILIAVCILGMVACKKSNDPTPSTTQVTKPAPLPKTDNNGCVTKSAIRGTWYYYAGNNGGTPIVVSPSQQIIFDSTQTTWYNNSTAYPVTLYPTTYADDCSTFTLSNPSAPGTNKTIVYTVTTIGCNKLTISRTVDNGSGPFIYTDSLRQVR